MGGMALRKGAAKLIVWDLNQASIDSAVSELSAYGEVHGYRVDVSDNDCVERSYALVKQECGFVDVLIQCAGVITSNRTFDKNSVDEIQKTMSINDVAPMLSPTR